MVKQYKKLMKLDNVDLQFDDDALLAIAQKSIRLKTGARGLRSVMESLMLNCMYEVPSLGNVESIRITRENVENGTEPLVVRKSA